ncbi:hypothetical protein TSAR_002493 [Trichomalopsis sarcophagae]|uniref:MutL C-terminal dimerisation domain-containing protein n=1 Tax=Trichomalopsis sarcophagae TaxID=543379 RepID=A0A232F9B8_9HYME|nr:hypothetical protein TSAR_002493 [Trichomalopsis sarcophagae]
MSNSLCKVDINNFSIEMCILELVKLSVERKSSSIAVRFNPKTHKIQVVDNGIGFSKYELSQICYNRDKNNCSQKMIFDEIISASNVLIITSRSEFSPHTFVKAISASNRQKLFEGYHRPSKGTTISIYDFKPSEWDNSNNRNCSIPYVIASVAFSELKVSFSIRNDEQQKVLLHLNNPHSPWDILKFFQSNKTCEAFSQSNDQVISQKELVESNLPSNDQVNISDSHIESPLSEWSNWSYKSESINKNNNNSNICSPFSEWSNWSYNPERINSNKSSNNKLSSSANQLNNLDNNFVNLSQMSIWSDWSYHPDTFNANKNARDSRFLSVSMYKRLPYRHTRTLNIANPALKTAIEQSTRDLKNVANFEVCDLKHKFEECKISKNTICSLEILRQVNKEFIAAITNDNGKKLLILIDQHAVHERIRYEWLIETYREKGSYKYFSVKLDRDLLISNINKNLLDVIAVNRKVLTRVGIHIKSIIGSTSCVVDAVPKCFVKKVRGYKNEYNLYRLIKNVKQLIMEVADGLSISQSVLPPVLPISINNVIASEACHEAIKFGDPLNVKECTLLLQTLQDTKAPTRCAHGRPTMIPLMNLSGIEKRKLATKVCILL